LRRKLLVAIAALATALAGAIPVGAADSNEDLPSLPPGVQLGTDSDNNPSPMAEKMAELRGIALEAQAQGKLRTNAQGVAALSHQEGETEFVELEREDEDLIWTVLGEFGEEDSPFTDDPTFGDLTSGIPGPLHNEIEKPDRDVDNSTIWRYDFSPAYYEDLLFSTEEGAVSMRNYYIEQSSGRYAVDGEVSHWTAVQYNAAHYGRDWCGSIVCATTWWFVEDSVNGWYQDMLDQGATPEQIDDYLSQFDVWDRYDHDGDGNFDEPDGYIDHFQSVHAGVGQETGGGAQGSDAIWSHRWYVQLTPIGSGGPTLEDGTVVPFGGTPVGGSSYWIGDYTIEPENGGLGVFAHEFAHDLGLPDLYDTSGNTCGSTCENSTGFWSLMSSGSYLNPGENQLGDEPGHMGAWEKLQLGWLDYAVGFPGDKSKHKLTPAEGTTTTGNQALIVILPEKEVVENIGDPFAGDMFYYSGSGNDLDNVMYQAFDLAGGDAVSAQVNYDIEAGWDYAYLVYSTDGGATWTGVETNLSDPDDPNGQNFGFGISGSSGGWVELTATLPAAAAGTDTLVGFRYWTDVAVVNPGFMADEIVIAGEGPFGAEVDDGFTLDGFRTTAGTETAMYAHYYIAANRRYIGYDEGLQTGAYNFGFLDNPDLQNWVERFPYQDGLLINYWDTSQSDNSTSAHPGEGLILPIDAHPKPLIRADGDIWRSRIQSYDSTFGLERTDAIELHWLSESSSHGDLRGKKKFKDSKQYWNPDTPTAGVINPHTGTIIKIKKETSGYMVVKLK
jgi:immune inhibitor A